MADGDVALIDSKIRQWTLLDAAVANDNGVWVAAGPYRKAGVVSVTGISGDTVTIYGSNAATIPANATDGTVLYNDPITENGVYGLGDLTMFVKAKLARSAGTVTVSLVASAS